MTYMRWQRRKSLGKAAAALVGLLAAATVKIGRCCCLLATCVYFLKMCVFKHRNWLKMCGSLELAYCKFIYFVIKYLTLSIVH